MTVLTRSRISGAAAFRQLNLQAIKFISIGGVHELDLQLENLLCALCDTSPPT